MSVELECERLRKDVGDLVDVCSDLKDQVMDQRDQLVVLSETLSELYRCAKEQPGMSIGDALRDVVRARGDIYGGGYVEAVGQ